MTKKPRRGRPTRNPLSRLKMYRRPPQKPRLFVWPENRPWTMEEVADYFSVPVNTVYTWNKDFKIPYIKPGRHALYSPEAVREFEERLRREAEKDRKKKTGGTNEVRRSSETMTPRQVAAYLKLSPDQLQDMIRTNTAPPYEVDGKALRFYRTKVEGWMAEREAR